MTSGQSEHLKKKFLGHFSRLGNVTAACRAAGIGRRPTVYAWQEHDDTFAAAFREAEIEATETMEEAARHRAVDGVRTETPVYNRHGQLVDTVVETKYSDTLLIFLLKARNPGKYRENVKLEHSGPGGGPIRTAEENPVQRLTTKQLTAMLAE